MAALQAASAGLNAAATLRGQRKYTQFSSQGVRQRLRLSPATSLSATPNRAVSSIHGSETLSGLWGFHYSAHAPQGRRQLQVVASSSKDLGEEQPAAAPEWNGAKPVPLLISVGVGLALRFLVPKPAAVTWQAWQLLAVFISTITGLVLGPLPVGAWAFLGLTTAVVTKTLTFSAAFSAFTSEVIWLIVISFFFARGFVKTGLGDRVATYFVKWLGKSTLGLSYGLTVRFLPDYECRDAGILNCVAFLF